MGFTLPQYSSFADARRDVDACKILAFVRLARPSMLMAPCTLVFDRLYRIELIVDRRGRACKVVDLVDLDIKGKRDVVPNELKPRIAKHRHRVVAPTGKVICPRISHRGPARADVRKGGNRESP